MTQIILQQFNILYKLCVVCSLSVTQDPFRSRLLKQASCGLNRLNKQNSCSHTCPGVIGSLHQMETGSFLLLTSRQKRTQTTH